MNKPPYEFLSPSMRNLDDLEKYLQSEINGTKLEIANIKDILKLRFDNYDKAIELAKSGTDAQLIHLNDLRQDYTKAMGNVRGIAFVLGILFAVVQVAVVLYFKFG